MVDLFGNVHFLFDGHHFRLPPRALHYVNEDGTLEMPIKDVMSEKTTRHVSAPKEIEGIVKMLSESPSLEVEHVQVIYEQFCRKNFDECSNTEVSHLKTTFDYLTYLPGLKENPIRFGMYHLGPRRDGLEKGNCFKNKVLIYFDWVTGN